MHPTWHRSTLFSFLFRTRTTRSPCVTRAHPWLHKPHLADLHHPPLCFLPWPPSRHAFHCTRCIICRSALHWRSALQQTRAFSLPLPARSLECHALDLVDSTIFKSGRCNSCKCESVRVRSCLVRDSDGPASIRRRTSPCRYWLKVVHLASRLASPMLPCSHDRLPLQQRSSYYIYSSALAPASVILLSILPYLLSSLHTLSLPTSLPQSLYSPLTPNFTHIQRHAYYTLFTNTLFCFPAPPNLLANQPNLGPAASHTRSLRTCTPPTHRKVSPTTRFRHKACLPTRNPHPGCSTPAFLALHLEKINKILHIQPALARHFRSSPQLIVYSKLRLGSTHQHPHRL